MDLYRKIIIFCRDDQNFTGLRIDGKLYKFVTFLSEKTRRITKFWNGLTVSKDSDLRVFDVFVELFFWRKEGTADISPDDPNVVLLERILSFHYLNLHHSFHFNQPSFYTQIFITSNKEGPSAQKIQNSLNKPVLTLFGPCEPWCCINLRKWKD